VVEEKPVEDADTAARGEELVNEHVADVAVPADDEHVSACK
jgi:hypothetical protein